MSTVRISGFKKHSSVNGPGVRYVLFFQGCPHHCPGCQNPETHDPAGGTERNTGDVIREVLQTKYLDGLTFSGGDPLMQPEAVKEMLRHAFEDCGMERVWCGHYEGNLKSRRVMEKNGFTYRWKTENLEVPLMNETRTGYVFCIERDEWERQKEKEAEAS